MSLSDAYKKITELSELEGIPVKKGVRFRAHCPYCKLEVGTDNPDCKYNQTRLHGKT